MQHHAAIPACRSNQKADIGVTCAADIRGGAALRYKKVLEGLAQTGQVLPAEDHM
jgi:hypothetical protein